MKSDADNFWDGVAGKLRKAKKLCPLSPEEAEAAFDEAPEVPLSEGEIESIVESVVSGDPPSWEPLEPQKDWDADADLEDATEQARQLHRNKGDEDEDTARTEKDLEEELLRDDDPEEDDVV